MAEGDAEVVVDNGHNAKNSIDTAASRFWSIGTFRRQTFQEMDDKTRFHFATLNRASFTDFVSTVYHTVSLEQYQSLPIHSICQARLLRYTNAIRFLDLTGATATLGPYIDAFTFFDIFPSLKKISWSQGTLIRDETKFQSLPKYICHLSADVWSSRGVLTSQIRDQGDHTRYPMKMLYDIWIGNPDTYRLEPRDMIVVSKALSKITLFSLRIEITDPDPNHISIFLNDALISSIGCLKRLSLHNLELGKGPKFPFDLPPECIDLGLDNIDWTLDRFLDRWHTMLPNIKNLIVGPNLLGWTHGVHLGDTEISILESERESNATLRTDLSSHTKVPSGAHYHSAPNIQSLHLSLKCFRDEENNTFVTDFTKLRISDFADRLLAIGGIECSYTIAVEPHLDMEESVGDVLSQVFGLQLEREMQWKIRQMTFPHGTGWSRG